MLSDLGQVEKRLERVEKDMRKMRSSELEHEQALLLRSKESLEKEQPLRELEMTPEEKKLIKGFMFLSQKPMLYVLNVGESGELGKDLETAVSRFNWTKWPRGPMPARRRSAAKWKRSWRRWTMRKRRIFFRATGCRKAGWCG